jgi:DNA-binding NarL/FixJ family response regulator
MMKMLPKRIDYLNPYQVEENKMIEQPKSERNIDLTDNQQDAALFRRPDIRLLDDKQWLFVQRRYRLSPRELQVAKHVCQGFANEEIAKSLRIRTGTVKTHLRNIYRRIHVTNKIGMLLTFLEIVAASNRQSEVHPLRAGAAEREQAGPVISPPEA